MKFAERFGLEKQKQEMSEDRLKRLSTEVEIISNDAKRKDWVEVWYSLTSTDLNSLTKESFEKLLPEVQDKLRETVNHLKSIEIEENEIIDAERISVIKKELDRISQII